MSGSLSPDWDQPSGCVVFKIDLVAQGNDFTIVIVATGAAHVVRTLEFPAVGAFIGVRGDKRVVGATVVAAGLGDFVLLNGHVSTLPSLGPGDPAGCVC